MYSNMDTGEFHQDGFSEVTAFFVPLIIEVIGRLGLKILAIVEEHNEDKINTILERIGMRTTVTFYKQTLVQLVYTFCFMPFVAYYSHEYLIKNTSYYLILVGITLFQLNEYFLDILLEYLLPHSTHKITKLLLRLATLFI